MSTIYPLQQRITFYRGHRFSEPVMMAPGVDLSAATSIRLYVRESRSAPASLVELSGLTGNADGSVNVVIPSGTDIPANTPSTPAVWDCFIDGTALNAGVPVAEGDVLSTEPITTGTVDFAPTITCPPTLSGVADVGGTLTSTDGTWSASPSPTYTYQWTRDAVAIGGATASTYVPVELDRAAAVLCEVTATNSEGTAMSPTSALTIPTAGVSAPVALSDTGAYTTGDVVPDVGVVLLLVPAAFSGSPVPTITYQWRRDAVDIGGATSATYTLVSADDGTSVDCIETATNSEGSANSTPENAIVVPAKAAPANTTPCVVTGPAIGAVVLGVCPGVWTGKPTPTLAYQWQRGGVDISGATSATYTLVAADDGLAVTVDETATNSEGATEQASSNSVTPTAKAAPVNVTAPAASGVTTSGSTLTAHPGTWTGKPDPTLTYQWQRDAVDIGGATSSTYVLTGTDNGTSITVDETATNSEGAATASSTALAIPAPAGGPGLQDFAGVTADVTRAGGMTSVAATPAGLSVLPITVGAISPSNYGYQAFDLTNYQTANGTDIVAGMPLRVTCTNIIPTNIPDDGALFVALVYVSTVDATTINSRIGVANGALGAGIRCHDGTKSSFSASSFASAVDGDQSATSVGASGLVTTAPYPTSGGVLRWMSRAGDLLSAVDEMYSVGNRVWAGKIEDEAANATHDIPVLLVLYGAWAAGLGGNISISTLEIELSTPL